MVALTQHDIFLLQLAVERWITDSAKQQRKAAKLGDAKALAAIAERAEHLSAVKAKLIQMRG